MASKYIGFELDESSRELIKYFIPASYNNVICHHITLYYGDNSDEALQKVMDQICSESKIKFMLDAIYNDRNGVQCFTATLLSYTEDGTYAPLIYRIDGERFHLTYSLGKDRKPMESLSVINNPLYKVRDEGILVTGQIKAFG